MTLDALLMAVALAAPAAPAAAGQEPGAVAPASYRATVSLDEGTRQLRGRVTIVVRAAARASAGPLRFAPGSTTVDVLTVDGVPAGATDSAG